MNSKPVWERLNVDQLLTQLVAWLPALFSGFLILAGFWAIHRLTRPALSRIFARASLDSALSSMLQNVFKFTLMTLGVLMALNQLGINVGAALAGLGVVGLTLGFAAKDTLSNVISGFLIFWDKPFRPGDWVTMGDQYGKVAEITMRTTRLHTWNNTAIIIPNEAAINQVMINHSAMGRIRIEIPIAGVALDEDFALRQEYLLKAVRNMAGVLADPPPDVVVKAINGAKVDLTIHAWIARADDERPVVSRILEASKPILSNAPQRAVSR